MADIRVQFMQIKQVQYDALTTKDSGTLYFCTDTNRIYVGSAKYSFGHPIELTKDVDYGSNLPTNTSVGQLFFQTVSSNFVLDNVYPVGAVYMSMNSTDPGTLFGGTWKKVQDKFLLGASSAYPSGSTGGEATHTLTTSEMPSHKHIFGRGYDDDNIPDYLGGSDARYGIREGIRDETSTSYYSTNKVGGGSAHNNMPPYLAVYIWYRTA